MAYVLAQMDAGRLRRMHPVLAVQSFAGPIVFHLLFRPMTKAWLGFDLDTDESVEQLARAWVTGMRPGKEG
jgi:hypothetical protein